MSAYAKLLPVLEELQTLPSAVAKDGSKALTRELRQQFARGQDPYGRKWRPLALSTLARGRRPPPLTDSGNLKRGTRARPLPSAGITLEVGMPYGIFHQTGTSRMPARKILPERGMPARWRTALARVYRARIGKLWGGRAGRAASAGA